MFFYITFGIRDGMFIWCGWIILFVTTVERWSSVKKGWLRYYWVIILSAILHYGFAKRHWNNVLTV